jgi:two-component system phosphate regulon sensor histidine kinase PhoR
LGLAIVKHIMIKHGGKIDIESTPGVGTEFRCQFPNR